MFAGIISIKSHWSLLTCPLKHNREKCKVVFEKHTCSLHMEKSVFFLWKSFSENDSCKIAKWLPYLIKNKVLSEMD